jgi:dTDP-4-dehydrorhamnose reductase
MKRILVTGVSGFLGRHVALRLRDRHRVVGTYRQHAVTLDGCATRPLDIAEREEVAALCRVFQPDVVVHTIALSDVDRCERDPDMADRVNVHGTAHVAQAAVEVGARLIYISTDQVYDGSNGDYNETDPPRPLMIYGHTKLEGERRAAAICSDVVILRLALMYGWGTAIRATFIDWMLTRLHAGKEVPLFIDQYRTPLYVVQGAEVIGRLIEAPEIRGVFNLGGGERLDRYAFGLKLCEVFELPKQYLKPIEMAVVGSTTPRPPDCSLNSAKISSLLHCRPLTVAEGLQAMKQQRGGS